MDKKQNANLERIATMPKLMPKLLTTQRWFFGHQKISMLPTLLATLCKFPFRSASTMKILSPGLKTRTDSTSTPNL